MRQARVRATKERLRYTRYMRLVRGCGPPAEGRMQGAASPLWGLATPPIPGIHCSRNSGKEGQLLGRKCAVTSDLDWNPINRGLPRGIGRGWCSRPCCCCINALFG
ncbi:hypothetical protein CC77DRAFT_733663 [Alternaria alternata]|uniref:Uncharacterized protein n=1 Tax=Alternaria alternata TaxID=5599 RepID=A0A177DTL3_ALTAL|nr:hypothetical protein CC77DRAFT_733663 [Alternaria alternata]OAG22501.1 hypothetical protein CC77DRAFT_733663 [Alternaria alternata]